MTSSVRSNSRFREVPITKASQSITNFTPPTTLNQAVGSTLSLSATGGASDNPVTFSATTASVCTSGGANGATLTIQSAGTCSVSADQAGNDNYSAATKVTVTISIDTPAQLYYIHADHLGTPRVITKATDNTKVWEWRNDDAFGNNPPDESPSGLGQFVFNLRFPGQYYDAETGLHQNWMRDYDPSGGRYIQSDPIGLDGGINTFAYVESTPLTLIDPEGLSSKGVPPEKQRWRMCNNAETKQCEEICGSKGMMSCRVSQTWTLVRMKVNDGPGPNLAVYGWKDGPLSCSCNDCDPEESPAKRLLRILTAPRPNPNDDPLAPYTNSSGPAPPVVVRSRRR
jgi:RHS repeat-associated protein